MKDGEFVFKMKSIVRQEPSEDMESFEDGSLTAHCQKYSNCIQSKIPNLILV